MSSDTPPVATCQLLHKSMARRVQDVLLYFSTAGSSCSCACQGPDPGVSCRANHPETCFVSQTWPVTHWGCCYNRRIQLRSLNPAPSAGRVHGELSIHAFDERTWRSPSYAGTVRRALEPFHNHVGDDLRPQKPSGWVCKHAGMPAVCPNMSHPHSYGPALHLWLELSCW